MASGGVSSKAEENEGDSWTLEEGARNAGNARMAMEKDDGNVDQDERRDVKTMHSIELKSKDHMMVLDKLNFKEYFMEKHAGFEEKFRYLEKGSKFYLEICCTNKMKNEIWETLTQFPSCVKCVRLDQNVHALLSLKNYQYVLLLEKELNDKQLNSLVKMQEKTFIYTKEENEKKVNDVVASLFVWETVPSRDRKYFYFTTPEFQKYRKEHENIDFKFEREAGAISFAVVKSVSDELMKALKDYDSGQQDFELSPSQKEVIQKWGNSKNGELQNWQCYNQLHSEGRYITTRKALLLKEKPTEEYIKKKLESLKIMALFEVESDDCVNLIGLNAKEAERAEKCFEESICEVPFCYNDKILEDIDSKEFKEYFDIWKGKFVFEGLIEAKSEAEGSLFATDDVIDRLQKFLFSNFCHNKNGRVFTKPIIHPDLCAKFESQDNLLEIEKKHNCQISKKYLGSLLANCWLLGRTSHEYFRVHLVAGHAESLNVDAVVCPCTSVMFPVNDCFGMYRDMMRVKSNAKKHKVNHTEEIIAPDDFRCERIMYLVTCEPNNAEKADIGSIVKYALLKADELSCKSLAIPLVLQPESIMEKKNQAKQIAIAIRNRPNLNTLEEVFVCECSDHPSIPIEKLWEKLFCETERYINFKPLQESALRMATPQRESTHIPAINVKIVNDTLVSQQVDVIVNTCRKDLDLTQGTVSQTILKKGGKSIQGELRKNYDKLRFGEIAVTKGGLLPCNYIFHGALYNWTPVGDFSLKVLKLMVWNCLAEADKLNCSSIAFPSLGTGNLVHPFHLVAETMYHTIQCYEQCHSDTKIKNISIVLYQKDKECIHQFETVEKMKENLFQSREECHPTQYLTCKKILASKPVTVDLLPSLSTWRWGCLLKLTFCAGGNGNGLIWDPINLCWYLKINPPPGWVASKLTWESYFEKESLDILNKRITSIELSLSNGTDGYKKQIDDFFEIMNDKDHFIKHLFIVFPNITFDELKKESERIEGHWKLGRKLDDFPITYMLSGSPQDVSRAKAEIDDMITKRERDLQERKFKEAAHGSSVDPEVNDFPIFETVTGVVMCADTKEASEIEELKQTIQDTGCKAKMDNNDFSIHIEGNLFQIVKANQRLIERWEKDTSKMDTMGQTVFIAQVPMSLRDYQAVKFFGNKLDWFKRISNQVEHTEGSLCISGVDANSVKNVEDDINQILKRVKTMSFENVLINVNDVELKKAMQYVEQKKPNVCLIKSDNDIEIITENYIDLQEAKGLLLQMSVGKTKENLQLSTGKINRRAGRTFAKTEEEGSNSEMPEKNNQDTNSNKMPLSMNQSMRSRKVELKTKEGLIILIYAGSITRLEVDCIVNAANENLMHGGGVAAAISEAAGYEFDQESRDYVQKNGSIAVGSCCVTSAGKLPYKCVIHTVGPRWGNYRDKNRCLQDLKDSVEATFIEADKRNMSSIAIPAISSGIFAAPRDKCVEEYYRAAMSFSKKYSFKSLQEIHFVDRDETMVRAIQELFLQREPSATIIGKSETLEKKNDTNAFVVEETVHSTMPISNSYTTVNVTNSLQISIHIGNITDIAAEAIVCPQDENRLSKDAIAKDIFRMIPDKQPLSKKMRYGDICCQELKENSKWKMIIHAATPVYDCEYAKDHSEFIKILKTIIQKILKTADEAKLHSIAIPLLGTGTEEYRTPVETCASSFFKAVMANKSELMHLNDIYLVLKEEKQEKMYLEEFAFINCKITQRPVTNNGKSDDFGKTMKEMPKEGENCCICMDTPTKPKQLRKCGHIFCKECIEQYFEYKPTCPSCGTIYGKVTGDQPPGTMSIRTNGSRLQGFNDSSGTIVLTYFFNDGNQGEEHPNPGTVYKGISRSGYLPNNKKGRLIAKLLNVAFSRRLVFTIGRSRTTGHDGVITWNDIHHKTRMEGGPARFGYPDPTYLERVLEELEAKGVTEESANDPEEYKEYSRVIRY